MDEPDKGDELSEEIDAELRFEAWKAFIMEPDPILMEMERAAGLRSEDG